MSSDAQKLAEKVNRVMFHDETTDDEWDDAIAALAELVRLAEEADTLREERDEALDIPGAELGWDGATTEWQRRAVAAEAERDKRRREGKMSASRDVYEAAVKLLIANGWRRQELGSGWWWKYDCEEEATLGGALEQQLDADDVDQRDAVAGEPAEYWG